MSSPHPQRADADFVPPRLKARWLRNLTQMESSGSFREMLCQHAGPVEYSGTDSFHVGEARRKAAWVQHVASTPDLRSDHREKLFRFCGPVDYSTPPDGLRDSVDEGGASGCGSQCAVVRAFFKMLWHTLTKACWDVTPPKG
uniref:Uncharacterized protein n=1 Tax=Chromera velia CCMP2878 TaxID=1169474 RepID=A0A0G4HI05_9ALVE|eukprot:Cvel_6886.t1-p1 / transcript=Cvel_6886.t1 / gene=Cvel_6886 / organism=Chromera_velia_CCMP2878 / gene_product=hypothetical protein / transcript_product=hypothetical protein / location=Cvel_scaffold348:41239-41661(+) / protein_length=141 / sequence_SO=supercontig / SO=protein_coding / is_pseudo=false